MSLKVKDAGFSYKLNQIFNATFEATLLKLFGNGLKVSILVFN
jgi:hypothetical protein